MSQHFVALTLQRSATSRQPLAAGRWHSSLRLCAFALISFFLLATPANAQRNVTDDEVNEVARDMFCPTCENTPLDVCPTQTCQDWRELIRMQLEQGMTKEEIHLYFADTFGDHVLAAPPRRGFDLTVWILPIVLIGVGGFFFGRYVYRLRQREAAAVSPTPTNQPAELDSYLRRIEQELQDS